ncbi:MAG: pantetheine-phosphate adenylyltransferase [Myxococcales bacterium]|nr:pantetheine-phosphate adenylyltransferase [Myxococcales bacterium]MCB9663405.1 pantetheine-phosphate adenylyltransferase [Alphaproteobacteria bacterium]
MARTAIYAGSFDPVTLGHLDVIKRGARLFDRLVVAVGNNPGKRYLFELEERQRFVREAVGDSCPNVEVHAFRGLLVDAAARLDADVVLRGLRALSDFDIEFRNGLANRSLTGIETFFLLADPALIYVSSSIVREIALHGGDTSHLVPSVVVEPLRRVYAEGAAR